MNGNLILAPNDIDSLVQTMPGNDTMAYIGSESDFAWENFQIIGGEDFINIILIDSMDRVKDWLQTQNHPVLSNWSNQPADCRAFVCARGPGLVEFVSQADADDYDRLKQVVLRVIPS